MAEQAYAYVTLIPVAKGFQKEIANQLGGTAGVGKKTGQLAGNNFSSGFGSAVKKLAVVAGGALAAAGLGRFFKDSVTQASDLGESINAVQKAYGDYAADVLKLGDGVAERLGLNSVDFNASAVRFSAFAERVVGAGGDVAGFVDSITTRASDFASVFNIEVSEALQVFQSGLSGEAEPLKRFGINLLDTEVKAYALESGLLGVGEQMTEDIKTQARYGLIMQETAKTAGDFADTSDGLANGQRILKAQFEETQAVIGNALLPIVIDLMNVVKDELLPIMVEFGDWLGSPEGKQAVEDFGLAVMGAVEFLVGLTQWVLENLDLLTNLGIAIGAASVAFKLYATRATLAAVATQIFSGALLTNPVFLMVAAVGLLTFAFLENDGAVEKNIGTYKKLKDAETDLGYTTKGVADKFKDSAYVHDKYGVALDETTSKAVKAATGISYVGTEVDRADQAKFANLPGQFNGVTVAADGTTNALNDTKDATIALTIVEQARERYKQEQITTLGRSTRTLQDFIDGMTRNAAVTAEVNNLTEVATSAVNGLGGAFSGASGELEKMSDLTSEVSGNLEAMANIAPAGFELVMGPNGPGFVSTMRTQGTGDIGAKTGVALSTREAQANLKAQGFSVSEIDQILQKAVGGTSAEIVNSFNKGVKLVNSETNRRIVGNIQGDQLAKLLADGFVQTGKIAASEDELTKALEDLTNTIAKDGADAYLTPFASGGLVTGPTAALIGEAGPEVVIPLNRFESMMGMGGKGKELNYYAAPNQSVDSEQELFQAMRRAKVVAGW